MSSKITFALFISLFFILMNTTGVSAQSFTETFTTVPPANWNIQNLSNPLGTTTWNQGVTAVWPAFNSASNDYALADFDATGANGTISCWLISPSITTLSNGDTISFYTRTDSITNWPDRMQVRVSLNGASTNVGSTELSVGDFSYLQLDINQSYTLVDYPRGWTKYTIVISNLPAGSFSGRIAFRYFVEDAGSLGLNSYRVGVDLFGYGNEVGGGGTLSTGSVGTTVFCGGSSVSVPFTSSGVTFTGGNVFTAQLSDAIGQFTAPVSIGTLTSTSASGTINAIIPTSITAGGLYRIRVVASTPSITGSANTVDLIANPATVSITPSSTAICPGGSSVLTASIPDRFFGISLGGGGFSSIIRFNAVTPNSAVIFDTFPVPGSLFGGDIGPNGFYYVLDDATFNLYRVSLSTFAQTLVGNAAGLNINMVVSGLAWNAANSTMYVMTTDGAISSLYTINPNTAAVTLVGNITNVPGGIWLAINNAGQAYAGDIVTNNLYSVNLTTGAGTLIGSLGVNIAYAQGADFDPVTGTLYMAAYDSTSASSQLRSVNTTTGASTFIGNLINNGISEVDALAIAGLPTYSWSTGGSAQTATVTAGGTYTVTMTNSSGCTATASQAITSGAVTPSISPSNPSVCAGNSVTLIASGGNSYSWSTGGNTASIIVNSQGMYSVTVTGTGNCTATTSVSVTAGTSPSVSISPSNPSICAGNSVTLTASGGNTYSWSTGANTTAISVNSQGTYTVTAIGNGGCSATATVTVVGGTLPSASISPSSPSVCAGNSVTLTASGGNTYSWSTGANATSISVTNLGSYTVTVTGNGGCTATASVTVTVGTPPNATITPVGSTTFCQGSSLLLTAGGGSSYVWSTGATTAGITVTSSGLYTVTVTNANGCTATASQNVTVNSAPIATITPSGSTNICPGNSVTLTAGGGNSYMWSTGSNLTSITVNSTGTYIVTVTGANNCTSSASQAVAVQSSTATINASGATQFCQGGNVTLTSTTGNSYLWSTGAASNSITATTAGLYSVTVTFTGGCSATASQQVSVVSAPTATITANGSTALCPARTVTLTASGGSNYLWSNGGTSASTTVSSSGQYVVTVIDGAGCTATASQTVTQVSNPSAAIIAGGNTTFCSGGTLLLTAGGGNTYLWSTGASTASISVNTTGIFSVTVTDLNTCSASASQNVIVVVPTASITPSGSTTFCPGGSVTLTANAGSSYLWSNGSTNNAINVSSAGNYIVTVVDANNCTASASQTVTIDANPTTSITTSGSGILCASGGSEVLTAGNGNSYLWSNGATTQSLTVTSAATYNVTVSLGVSCSATASQIITQAAAIGITGVITPSTGNNGAIDITVSNVFQPVVYLWSNGSTTEDVSGLASGTYTVTVTDANSCTATQTFSIAGVGIADLDELEIFNVYPNPAQSHVQILVKIKSNTDAELLITDMFGKRVYYRNLNSATDFFFTTDTREWAAGLYNISLLTGGLRATQKLVVIR